MSENFMQKMARVEANVAQMREMGAPDEHLKGYLEQENVTPAHARQYLAVKQSMADSKASGPEMMPGSNLPESVQAGILGMGRTGDKVIAGVKNLAGADVAADQAQKDAAYSTVQEAHPAATMIGETLPYFAVPMGAAGGAATKVASKVAPKVGAAMARSPILTDAVVTGGLLGGATYSDNQAAGAAVGAGGGALGAGVGALTGRMIKPVQSKLEGMRSRLASWADGAGFDLTPAQKTGSDTLRKMESGMQSNPASAGLMQRVSDKNQKVVNRIAAKELGEAADEISDDVLGSAASRIGREFDDLTKNTTVKFDDALLQEMSEIQGMEIEGVDKWVDRVLSKVNGDKLSGKDYQNLQSRLNAKARSIFKSEVSDKELGFALIDLKDALDEAMERSLGGSAKDRFAKARHQWKVSKTLESPKIVNSGSGDISLRNLANRLARIDKRGYTRGGNKSDFYEMARFGKAFPEVADSGTASRQWFGQSLLMGGGLAGGALAGDGQADTAALGLMGGLLAPNVLTRGYLAGGGYPLTAGLLPQLTGRLGDRGRGLLTSIGGRAGAALSAD